MSDDSGRTLSGIRVPIVLDEKQGAVDPEKMGKPGQFPYTRGIYPDMYRGRLWTMRQYAGFGAATETNERFRYLLRKGQTGLSVAFDLATQIGYDSDHPMASGEVGRTGVAIDSLEDMQTLFRDIPLDKVSTSMTINSTAVILLCMYIAVGKSQGVPPESLTGTVQNDILKEFIARGTYILPPRPSMKIVTDMFAFCGRELPRYNSISISGYHIREAGATAAQEIAFTLSNAIAYVEAATQAGLDIDSFAPRLSFFFAAHNDLFEEVAKFRAARRLWAIMMKTRFGAKDERSMRLRFHTQTGGSTLTAQQPENNIVRTTIEALAAVLGGTQSLHTNAYDEALALPSEKSAEIALRTQQIIAAESGVTRTADPLAGSYYIEYLTDELEKQARLIMDEIESQGGSVSGIESGYFKKSIAESAYRFQREVEEKRLIIVGVNEFISERVDVPEVLKLDPELEKEQITRVKALREKRDSEAVATALSALKNAASGKENIVPFVLRAVERFATVGEISDTFREVWGEYNDNR